MPRPQDVATPDHPGIARDVSHRQPFRAGRIARRVHRPRPAGGRRRDAGQAGGIAESQGNRAGVFPRTPRVRRHQRRRGRGGARGRQDVFARPAGLRLSADGHQVGHVREQGREESGEILFPELSGARGSSRRDDETEGRVARAAGFAGERRTSGRFTNTSTRAAFKAASS